MPPPTERGLSGAVKVMGVEAGGCWRLLVGRSLKEGGCGHREVSTEGSEAWALLTLKMRPGLQPRTRPPLGPRKGRSRLRASTRDQPAHTSALTSETKSAFWPPGLEDDGFRLFQTTKFVFISYGGKKQTNTM